MQLAIQHSAVHGAQASSYHDDTRVINYELYLAGAALISWDCTNKMVLNNQE